MTSIPKDFRTLDRTWIVAEIGVNHEGDEKVAADLIAKAAAAGADAVKFQTYEAEHYVSTVQPERRARVKRFELSRAAFTRLGGVARELGVQFFSTPLHAVDADFLDPLVQVFKISSGDLTYLDLIRHVAAKNKPIIVSTGSGTRDEIAAAILAVEQGQPGAAKRGKLLLMHCVAAYPAPREEANLRNIGWLAREFGVPVGYSDHTLGTKACELAVAAGAVALEKHFTYRKEDQAFHDHAISADPSDMKALVETVRTAEIYLGQAERKRGAAEEKNLAHMRRSLAASVDIPAGVPVEARWLTALRPAWGLHPHDQAGLIGKRLKRVVPAGDLIRAEDVSDS